MLSGIGVSLLAPSSTSISTLAAQTVRLGYVDVRRMLVVLLGADIGLTLMVQLLSLRIDHFAPVLLLIGVALYQYTSNARSRGIGQVILSFGFQFLGIGFIQNAAAGMDPAGDLAKLLEIASHYPLAMATLAALLAMTLQSSTATIALILALSQPKGGGIGLPPALALAAVFGANVGTSLTLLVLGWNDPRSRRLGAAATIGKILVAVVALLMMNEIVRLLTHVSIGGPARQVANAHTGFNIAKAIILLPLTGFLALLAEQLIPARTPDAEEETNGCRYITAGTIDGSNLALGQSMREILRVADIVRGMGEDLWKALRNDDEQLVRKVSERDNLVDRLDSDIKGFLTRLDSHALDPDQAAERMRQLRYLSELENIGDVIDKNLCELALKKIRLKLTFSKEGWAELDDLDRLISENMLIADAAFHTRDRALAEKLLRHKEHIDRRVRDLRDRHFARLADGPNEPPQTSAVHLDLLTNLRRINSHASHVAFAILQEMSMKSPVAP
jgi:phosphate:Na+ symporter